MPTNGRFRIASNTKMFTATVILQLVGERTIDLDAPVERYLPGIVRGHGNDGRRITVRMLLQQTSGLPDYDTIVADAGGSLGQIAAHTYFEPRQLIDAALAEKRSLRARHQVGVQQHQLHPAGAGRRARRQTAHR